MTPPHADPLRNTAVPDIPCLLAGSFNGLRSRAHGWGGREGGGWSVCEVGAGGWGEGGRGGGVGVDLEVGVCVR